MTVESEKAASLYLVEVSERKLNTAKRIHRQSMWLLLASVILICVSFLIYATRV